MVEAWHGGAFKIIKMAGEHKHGSKWVAPIDKSRLWRKWRALALYMASNTGSFLRSWHVQCQYINSSHPKRTSAHCSIKIIVVAGNAGGQGGIANPPLYLNQVGVNTNLFLVIARTKEMFLTFSKNTG
jgi:hypothetical protein